MANKISFIIPKITLSWLSFLKAVSKLESIGINVFMLTFISFEYLRWSDRAGVPAYLFGFVLTLLSLRIIKWILSKGDHFPTIPFDIQALLLVSAVAVSLFVGIVFFQTKQNVWGGSNLRMLSGVSVVGLWFIYYIVSSSKDAGKLVSRAFLFLMISPLLALILFVFNLNAQIGNLLDIILVIQAGTLWLFLTQNKLRWLALLNLIFSIIAFFYASAGAQVSALSAFLFSLIFVIYFNRKKLPVLIVQIEKTFQELKKRKIKLDEFLSRNVYFLYACISLVILVVGLIAVFNNPSRNELAVSIQRGMNEISTGLNAKTLIIGEGLKDINSTTALTVINSFGILPLAAFFLLIVSVFRTLIQQLKKAETIEAKGKLISIITIISVILLYFFIYKAVDIVILLFWMFIALASLISGFAPSKKDIIERLVLKEYENSTDKNIKTIKQVFQKVMVFLVLGLLVFVMFQLNGIIKLMA